MQNSSTKITVIKAKKNPFGIDFRELSEYRELLYFFVWRDIKVKYKQTLLGVLWAILVPGRGPPLLGRTFQPLSRETSCGRWAGSKINCKLLF